MVMSFHKLYKNTLPFLSKIDKRFFSLKRFNKILSAKNKKGVNA